MRERPWNKPLVWPLTTSLTFSYIWCVPSHLEHRQIYFLLKITNDCPECQTFFLSMQKKWIKKKSYKYTIWKCDWWIIFFKIAIPFEFPAVCMKCTTNLLIKYMHYLFSQVHAIFEKNAPPQSSISVELRWFLKLIYFSLLVTYSWCIFFPSTFLSKAQSLPLLKFLILLFPCSYFPRAWRFAKTTPKLA